MCWAPCERVMNCMVSTMMLTNLGADLSPNHCVDIQGASPLHAKEYTIYWVYLYNMECTFNTQLCEQGSSPQWLDPVPIMSTVTCCRTVRSILEWYRHWHSCYQLPFAMYLLFGMTPMGLTWMFGIDCCGKGPSIASWGNAPYRYTPAHLGALYTKAGCVLTMRAWTRGCSLCENHSSSLLVWILSAVGLGGVAGEPPTRTIFWKWWEGSSHTSWEVLRFGPHFHVQ